MANREGLGISRKFADGAIHENASGQFKILDRYLDDDGTTVMLKFEWLTGDHEGEIETNKEKNVNASLHKFRVSRSLPVRQGFASEPLYEKLDAVSDSVEFIRDNMVYQEETANYRKYMMKNIVFKEELLELLTEKMQSMQNIIEDQQTTISSLTNHVEQLLGRVELLSAQQESMNRQQETLDKLIVILGGVMGGNR